MKVILTQNVPNLGSIGSKVKVANGYARNYLLPKGLALVATEANIKKLQRDRKQAEMQHDRDILRIKELAKQIRKMSCTIVKQVGEGEKLFGSVSPMDIVKAMASEGVTLEKKQIILDEPIKKLGIYPVKIKLSPEVESVLKVWVVK